MSVPKIRILHISDLHIMDDAKRYKFHQDISTYISSQFNGKVDFLIVSGDLGDKCLQSNVNIAKTWMDILQTNLGLNDEQIIMCAGNHDIDTGKINDTHYEQCFNYKTGYEYMVSPSYPSDAFDQYKNIANKYKTSQKKDLGNNDMIYETPHVRFLILNSSWLCEIEKQKRVDIITELKQANQDDINNSKITGKDNDNSSLYKKAKERFGDVLCVEDIDTSPNVEKVFKWSFNHSQNTRQQIGTKLSDHLDANKHQFDDDKINILIFHHPEFCLHFLEHFKMDNIAKSGSYYNVHKFSDLLICGHIHPDENINVTEEYFKLPHLVGGACHLPPPGATGKPLFYYYELENNMAQNKFTCHRYVYTQDPESTGNFLTWKPESIPIMIDKNKRKDNTIFYSQDIKNEKDILKITDRFKSLFIRLTLDFFNKNYDVKSSSHEIWYKNKLEKPNYLINSIIHQFVLNNEVSIILDIFSSDILLLPAILNNRVGKYFSLDVFNKKEKIVPDHIEANRYIYVPILIDPFYSLMKDGPAKEAYMTKHRSIAEKNFSKDKYVYDKLKFFLDNIYDKPLTLSKELNLNNDIFLGLGLIKCLLTENDDFLDKINYTNLVLGKDYVLEYNKID